MEQKIWDTGDSKVGGYLNLARNYRKKHGSLLGFLDKYGAVVKDNGKAYKVRVDGQRVKLASLTSYNAYQSLRQGKTGYKKVRQELLDLGIPEKEIESFIADDKQKYKQIVSEVKAADLISAEPVQKGHIGSLQAGFPDVSGNIEAELRSINAAKQGRSPLPEALLAEGRPRTSQEAFAIWKDPSGFPSPSDYSYEQRQQLRSASSVEELNDLLASFDKPDVIPEKGSIRFKPGKFRRGLTRLALPSVAGSALSLALGAEDVKAREQLAEQDPSFINVLQRDLAYAERAADIAGAVPNPASPVAETTGLLAGGGNLLIDAARDPIGALQTIGGGIKFVANEYVLGVPNK